MKSAVLASSILCSASTALAFQSAVPPATSRLRASDGSAPTALGASRREILETAASLACSSALLLRPLDANAAAAIQDSLDTDEFLRTGVDGGGNMGVSSQAGKSRPQTGVVFRDGTDVLQSGRGDVSAELLVGTKENPAAVLVSFNAPYKLETGSVFDVECRDGRTGDGAFLAVTRSTGGKSLEDLPASFFLERLFDPTGRFSFYGPPTDVKVRGSSMEGDTRVFDISFSNLSQSTNAEIPRRAVVAATVPRGAENAVMLVASSSAGRWKKEGGEKRARGIVDSFRAVPAPKTGMRLRAKDRSNGANLDF